MKDRRKFIRFPVRLGARYSEENQEDLKQQCSIANISREGMGVTVYLKAKLSLGCMLKFMVDVPEKEKSIFFIGTLNWIGALGGDPDYNYKGGIKLITIDSKDKWALLDYAYEAWKEKQEGDGIKEASSK
ncbi:MAG: PilZ domain-containing protein [Deltaproteobacteria bacterium]|nr:PilZ domain-containing protein [Deltaproteobacteria bacterium]